MYRAVNALMHSTSCHKNVKINGLITTEILQCSPHTSKPFSLRIQNKNHSYAQPKHDKHKKYNKNVL